jgi:hypothetical protein
LAISTWQLVLRLLLVDLPRKYFRLFSLAETDRSFAARGAAQDDKITTAIRRFFSNQSETSHSNSMQLSPAKAPLFHGTSGIQEFFRNL